MKTREAAMTKCGSSGKVQGMRVDRCRMRDKSQCMSSTYSKQPHFAQNDRTCVRNVANGDAMLKQAWTKQMLQ